MLPSAGASASTGTRRSSPASRTPSPRARRRHIGTIVGPPDNKSWSLNFTGTARQLPFSSVFAVNASYQENTSQTTLLNTIETGTLAAPTVTR